MLSRWQVSRSPLQTWNNKCISGLTRRSIHSSRVLWFADNNTKSAAWASLLQNLSTKTDPSKGFPKGPEKTDSGAIPTPKLGQFLGAKPAPESSTQNPNMQALLQDLVHNLADKPSHSKFRSSKEISFLDELFGVTTQKKRLEDLKYWHIYPKQVKKWLVFTKTPKGFYNESGQWVAESDSEIKSFKRYQQASALNAPPEEADEEGEVPAESEGGEDTDAPTPATGLTPRPTHISTVKTTADWEALFQAEQQKLPAKLRGQFRFGVTYDQIKNFHPKIKRLFSYTFASKADLRAFNKKIAIEKWKQHPLDTASDAIQIDILTQRIRGMIKHLMANKQDKHNLRNLQVLVRRRKGLILHLKKRDVPLYFQLLKEIRLRDKYELYTKSKLR